MLEIILCILLFIIAINIVSTHNNLYLIVYFSAFSFITACIYFISKAPDLALAEIAVGCAFIPLIYTIAISKQKRFTVLFFTGNMPENSNLSDVNTDLNLLLNRFANHYKIKIDRKDSNSIFKSNIKSISKPGNADLIITYDPNSNCLIVKGIITNIMLNTLEQMNHSNQIKIVRVKDYGQEI